MREQELDDCLRLAEPNSYIGCEYWPTVTSNSMVTHQFNFAVAISNPGTSAAVVEVTRDDAVVATRTVDGSEVAVITLPWVDSLKNNPNSIMTYASGIHRKSAYRLKSSAPITVYQFNPLESAIDPAPADCLSERQGVCKSVTNDASLLIPTSALGKEYYVVSYPSHLGKYGATSLFPKSGWHSLPGFAVVTATEDKTAVEVTAGGRVRAGEGVPALMPGESARFELNAGDVLSLLSDAPDASEATCDGGLCSGGIAFDLTGTHIRASHPVSVIAGHDCTMLPYNMGACDHLEESMFPVISLGKEVILAAPMPFEASGEVSTGGDLFYVRVLSAANDNLVFVSASDGEGITLDEGQWKEFGPFQNHTRVVAQDKILVASYLVSQEASIAGTAGDPSMSVAVPIGQYRKHYSFFVPETFGHSYIDVLTVGHAQVRVDGESVAPEAFEIVGSHAVGTEEPRLAARLPIDPGTHLIESDIPVGVNVYGFSDYTSYAYPGGLALNPIVIK